MSDATYASDVAFTPSVKALQARKGSRARVCADGGSGARGRPASRPSSPPSSRRRPASSSRPPTRPGSPTSSTAAVRPGSCACSTTERSGSPTYAGNRQYITQGNLADNPKAHLFLIDYAHRRRVKIWGEARVVEGDAGADRAPDAGRLPGAPRAGDDLHRRGVGRELPAAHPAALEAADVAAALAERDRRIAALEAEVQRLRGGEAAPPVR